MTDGFVVSSSCRNIRVVEKEGVCYLEVVESGTFRPLALVSVPCRRLDEKDALIVLKQELVHAEVSCERVSVIAECPLVFADAGTYSFRSLRKRRRLKSRRWKPSSREGEVSTAKR